MIGGAQIVELVVPHLFLERRLSGEAVEKQAPSNRAAELTQDARSTIWLSDPAEPGIPHWRARLSRRDGIRVVGSGANPPDRARESGCPRKNSPFQGILRPKKL